MTMFAKIHSVPLEHILKLKIDRVLTSKFYFNNAYIIDKTCVAKYIQYPKNVKILYLLINKPSASIKFVYFIFLLHEQYLSNSEMHEFELSLVLVHRT